MHIKSITRKANSAYDWDHQTIIHLLRQDNVLHLYFSLVRRHLEYVSEIWNPYLIGDIQTLEKLGTEEPQN